MTTEINNNGVHAFGGEPVEIIKLDRAHFQLEMNRVQTMKLIGAGNEDYYSGYMRGLRRAYHGERFGTPEEHKKWLSLIGDSDLSRDARGRGYRDGLRGVPDSSMSEANGNHSQPNGA